VREIVVKGLYAVTVRVRFYVRPGPGPPVVSHTAVSTSLNATHMLYVFVVPRAIVSFRGETLSSCLFARILAVIEIIILADLKADGLNTRESKGRDCTTSFLTYCAHRAYGFNGRTEVRASFMYVAVLFK